MATPLEKARALLQSVLRRQLTHKKRVEETITLTRYLLEASQQEKTKEDRKRESKLAKMMQDPLGKEFVTLMTDQCFRSQNRARTADQLYFLIKKYGIPHFLEDTDRIKFLLFQAFGKYFPQVFVPFIKKNVREEMGSVLLPEDPKKRAQIFQRCKKDNIQINLNRLGEAILGEKEAKERLRLCLEDLSEPHVSYISVKISSIFSQINLIGWEDSLATLSERLRQLYRASRQHLFEMPDKRKVEKFVNLDMEEYKDLDLTVAAFQKVLNEKEFCTYKAGIVLQSYLPNAYKIQQDLTEWAKSRFQQTGVPIKLRIVKGANLAMEKVESSLKGWEIPTFEKKIESDANFKRMVEYAAQPTNAAAVHIGIGSHNLFDIAYAFILRAENQVEEKIGFEMLHGMARPSARAVQNIADGLVLYAPFAEEQSFQNAVAYLVRRLDENTGPENFLRNMFYIEKDHPLWDQEKIRFSSSVYMTESLPSACRRTQNRFEIPASQPFESPFQNEPDTDFSRETNRLWAKKILQEWEAKSFSPIPLVIAGKEVHTKELNAGIDPSRPTSPLYHYALADTNLATDAINAAKKAQKAWQATSLLKRSQLLYKTAHLFRENRFDLIGSMIADGGKNIWEADPEVSEAIDFLEYYRKTWEHFQVGPFEYTAKGTVLVAPPWNFPCSIPTGAIAAALITGNTVLFKPAPESVLVGWMLVNLFWQAGVPKEVLQFINCEDDPIGSDLIQNADIHVILLTGATQTAKKMLKLRRGSGLYAETGGKNALIATALCDRDLAIRDIVQSAFGHSGQKCSACSLAILEAELYDDPHFLQTLKDATESLWVGSAWDSKTKVGPLIRRPEGALKRGLTTLEEGETWLLKPQVHPENPLLWSPGIKIGVTQNSFTHQNELFGPVLGVMRASSLEHALTLANGTPYGLTSGLHSLDEREHAFWKKNIEAGNLYINRTITGAIVERQPFGGCKASSFGGASKAGGPNFLVHLCHVKEKTSLEEKASLAPSLISLVSSLKDFKLSQEERALWKKSAQSYTYWAEKLKKPKDVAHVLGQENDFYMVPLERCLLRVVEPNALALVQIAAACLICQTPLEVSSLFPWPRIQGITMTIEEENSFLMKLKDGARIRTLGKPTIGMLEKAKELALVYESDEVLSHGRFELLHYMREVSVSFNYHRYGYIPLTKEPISKKD